MKSFVYIVDDFFTDTERQFLAGDGISINEYKVVPVSGTSSMPDNEDLISAERLLVFLSTFNGYLRPAIELAKKIKKKNPNAIVYLRSETEISPDPVFTECLKKTGRDRLRFKKIIKDFLREGRSGKEKG